MPEVLDWATMTHNSFTNDTSDTTMLCASDRDVFRFWLMTPTPLKRGNCRMDHPICISGGSIAGIMKLDKNPWIASFLRAVCMYLNLGAGNFEQIIIRHSKLQPSVRVRGDTNPYKLRNPTPAPPVGGARASGLRFATARAGRFSAQAQLLQIGNSQNR